MLLTFNEESLQAIKDGRKYTTIRANYLRWKKWWESDRRKVDLAPLHVYAGNPRSGGKFVAETGCAGVRLVSGREFNTVTARQDGFSSLGGLIKALAEINGLSESDVRLHTWAVISFNPHPIQEALGATHTTWNEYRRWVTNDGRIRQAFIVPIGLSILAIEKRVLEDIHRMTVERVARETRKGWQ